MSKPFHVSSSERVKRVAKSLAAAIKAGGRAGFPYNRCLEIVSAMYGHASYRSMLSEDGGRPASQDDCLLEAAEVSERRTRHVGVLVDAGIPHQEAEALVDAVKPTDRADVRKIPMFLRLPMPAEARAAIDDHLADRRDLSMLLSHKTTARARKAVEASLFMEFAELTMSDDHEAERVVDYLIYLHDLGHDVGGLRKDVMTNMLVRVDLGYDERAQALTEGTARAFVRFVEPLCGDAWAESLDDDAQSDLCYRLGYYDLMIDRALKGGMDAAAAFVEKSNADFVALGEAGATLADLAKAMADSFCVGPHLSENVVAGPKSRLGKLYRSKPPSFAVVDGDAADAELSAAFGRMFDRGHPRIFSRGGYFDETHLDIDDTGFFRGSARKPRLMSDVLASADLAKLGLGDLADEIVRYAWLLVTVVPEPDALAEWTAMLTGLGVDRDFVHPDLLAATEEFCLQARWDRPPAEFAAAISELRLLGRDGFTLTDFAACMLADDFRRRWQHDAEMLAGTEGSDLEAGDLDEGRTLH